MKNFDELCKTFEAMDAQTYTALLVEKSATVLPALALVTGGIAEGAATFATFILGAIAADGKLAEEEYVLCEPFFRAFFGDKADFETCRKTAALLKPESRELKKCVNDMTDLLGRLSDDLKDDLVLICMMICAIDGKISLKEKLWIKQLIK